MINDRFSDLPPVERVRGWATRLIAAQGDAFCSGLYKNGLRVIAGIMGKQINVVREETQTLHHDGTSILQHLQMAIFPDTEFTTALLNNSKGSKAPVHGFGSGFDAHSNHLTLPFPQIQPILLRAVEWRSWVPELDRGNCEIVTYTLYELDPDFQQQVTEAQISAAIPSPRR